MENAIRRAAVQSMALHARECGETVSEAFSHRHDWSFLMPGHTNSETIQRSVDITPELIIEAEALLSRWCAQEVARG
jgi:hypothetical protein